MPVVMPFVLENITSKDWKCRDAAIMALGEGQCVCLVW